jgi:hypothetical protein
MYAVLEVFKARNARSEHWASILKVVVVSILTLGRHIFQAWPVWLHTQSTSQTSYSPEYTTPTQKIMIIRLH